MEEINKKLMQASMRGQYNVVLKLLKSGVDVNCQNDTGATPLMRAIKQNKKDVADLLLSYGADVNKQSRSGRNALMVALAHNADIDVIDSLLAKGVNVNAITDSNQTALMIAIYGDNFDVAIKLLELGADFTREDSYGSNAFQFARDESDIVARIKAWVFDHYGVIEKRIAEVAYFKAEKRGFVSGHEEEDWLEAEKDVLALFSNN